MQDTPTTTTTPPPSGGAGAALAALYLGFFLVVVGGYFNLAGFEKVDLRPIAPQAPTAATGFLPQFGESTPFTPAPAAPPTFQHTLSLFFSQDSSSTKWTFILGCLIAIWGLWRLQRLRPATADNSNYLQSSYRDGVNPLSLHAKEDLEIIHNKVAELHQRKVLWSLPFWVTTLILLFVNEGTLGNPTFLGVSDLWLMGITLGVYIIFSCVYWRCPACDGQLPRYHDRFICDKCGLQLSSADVTYSGPPAAGGRPEGSPERTTIAQIEEGAMSRLIDSD